MADLDALRNGPLADLSDPAEVLRTELPFEGRVWDIRRDTVEFAGTELVREYVDHPGAVGILALDADDRILLINQYRHPIREREWELPAGLLDVDGEPPLDAAKRELAEEVDLVAENWVELISFATTPGGSNERLRIFQATGISAMPVPFQRSEEEAEIVTRWVSLDEAVTAVLDGRVSNSILIVAVLAAHARRS